MFFKQLDFPKKIIQFGKLSKTQVNKLICNISRTPFVEFLVLKKSLHAEFLLDIQNVCFKIFQKDTSLKKNHKISEWG